MFCVPFLGSESLSPEAHNRFYTRLEGTAFISPPTSKFDLSRLASKRHLCIQQDSLVSLAWVAGMSHGGAKAPIAEQTFNGLTPSTKSLDVVKKSQKPPKVQFLTGSKPSQLNSSRPKPSIQNFEEQLAVLERIHLQSQVSCNGTELSEEAQVTHKFDIIRSAQQKRNYHATARSESMNRAYKSPHTSLQQSLEKQFSGVNLSGSNVDHRRAGLMHAELIVEANFTGHEPVWNEPFLGVHRAQSSKNHTFGLPWDGNERRSLQLTNSGINGSNHSKETNVFESNEEKDEVQRNAQDANACQTGRQLRNSIQHLDKENLRTQGKNLVNGCHSLIEGFRVGYSYPDTQLSGSMNGTSMNGFHLKKWGCGMECPSVGEPVSTTNMVEGMQAKESVDDSSSSCKVAFVRMPVYRMATPLQQSLKDSIFYLESLGADCTRLFRDDPTAMKCTVKQLRALVCALERYGLKWNDFGRIFNLCPKVLHLKPDSDLKAVRSFLFDEVGLSRKDFGKVIRRCPRLLVADIHEQLRPTLSFLCNLGYLKMGQVISNNPTLLSFSVERKLIPKLRFLESLGFTYREAASMVVRFPAIFNYSINDNLQPKYDYLVHEMGGSNKDLLAFPQYFGYSLETRIRPRHECIAKLDVSLSIQAILKLSDAEFSARFLPGGGHDHPLSVSPETSNTMLQDCSLDSVQFVCFEHPEVRALVSV